MSDYDEGGVLPLTPRAPENVRIVCADGMEIPCELRYVGREVVSDGLPSDIWAAVSEYVLDVAAGDTVKIGVLPPRVSVVYSIRPITRPVHAD